MVVVLVILGLALSIVAGFVPRRNATLELAAVTARVRDALRLARSRAITEDRSIAVAIAPNGHGLSIDGAPVSFGPSVAVTSDQSGTLFEPDGSASGGSLIVRVGPQRAIVAIDWLTGRVSVNDAR